VSALVTLGANGYDAGMRLFLDNLPASLQARRETLAQCLEAFNRARHVHAVYLFGSHARGEARPDSDVDLCIVADGAERQLVAARDFRRAMREVADKPAFSLVPITPQRLQEKRQVGDHFFHTVLHEGVLLAEEN